MIRAAIALTTGLVLGSIAESAPVRAVRRWVVRVDLGLTLRELVDTSDDIVDAIGAGDFLAAEGLTDYYTELSNHRDALRVKLRDLS